MPLFKIELDSGREIVAIAAYQAETYLGGLAIGRHSEERVHRDLDDLSSFAKSVVPAPVKAILPDTLGQESKSWCLPMYAIITWFVSDPVDDHTMHGSHLTIIAFQDGVYAPFTHDNEDAIKQLKWEEYARDFCY